MLDLHVHTYRQMPWWPDIFHDFLTPRPVMPFKGQRVRSLDGSDPGGNEDCSVSHPVNRARMHTNSPRMSTLQITWWWFQRKPH